MAKTNTPATAPVEGVTKPEGFTAAQYRLVCETIAGHADTLCNLLMLVQGNDNNEWQEATALDAALLLGRKIGTMADTAVRPTGEVIGDANRWNYGPNFADLGKEASHG